MKKIIIDSHKLRLLREADNGKFNISVFKKKISQGFHRMIEYCNECFGNPIGEGSSRIVYQIDDEWVLKLAKNRKGEAQNKEEYKFCKEYEDSGILPYVMDYTEEDVPNVYIIMEQTLVCDAYDFKAILKMPFYYEPSDGTPFAYLYKNNDYEKYLDYKRSDSFTSKGDQLNFCDFLDCINYSKHDKKYEKMLAEYYKKNIWFKKFADVVKSSGLLVGDLCSLANLGIVNRNGKPCIVISDAGFTKDVAREHYFYLGS